MKKNLLSRSIPLLLVIVPFLLTQCTKPPNGSQDETGANIHKAPFNILPGTCPYDCHDIRCKQYDKGYCGDGPPPPRTITYRGIRPDDPGGDPLDNPERGFRFTYSMFASNLKDPFNGPDYSGNFTSNLQADEVNYGANKVRLTHIYFYLTDYLHTTISASAFANMQRIFDFLKSNNFKVLLRFAYRVNDQSAYESLGDISTHLAQLQSFLARNESLLYVVQAGFVGLWGEWHNSGLDNFPNERNEVIRLLLQTIPASRKTQVRAPAIKNAALGAYSGYLTYDNGSTYTPVSYPALSQDQVNRIGFHDDWFVLDQGAHPEYDINWGTADFYQMQTEGPNTTVDGEMPATQDFPMVADGNLGGWYAAQRMRMHGYTSFNLEANYDLNLNAWQTQVITPNQLRTDNTVVTDDYFVVSSGAEIGRIAFQYIRDHLGYRFQLRSAQIPASVLIGATAQFDLKIKNFGFSRLINYRPAYLVLIDANNNVREIPTGVNAQDWYPNGQNDVFDIVVNLSIDNSYTPGTYRVGLWLPDASNDLRYNPAYSIKLANGTMQWWTDPGNRYLINILTTMDITQNNIGVP